MISLMTFKLLGMEWDILAIIVFIAMMIFSTEIVKPLLKKIVKIKNLIEDKNWFNLILSWLIGWSIYFILYRWMQLIPTRMSILQFLFFTLLANGGYRYIKKILKKIKELKDVK